MCIHKEGLSPAVGMLKGSLIENINDLAKHTSFTSYFAFFQCLETIRVPFTTSVYEFPALLQF
jgi:hypothetical protein